MAQLPESTSSQLDPFICMEPYSVKADEKGLSEGKLIMDNLATGKSLGEKQAYLHSHSGVCVEVTHFQNWGNTQKSLLLYAKPKKTKEICDLVKAASEYKPPIKIGVGGSYHSWSPMFPDDGGLLINTCDLTLDSKEPPSDRIYLHVADDRKMVTISPGVTTGELMKFFLKHDVCFESDVILPTVTYGGVLSGGCHGTGKDQTSLSDWIVSLKLVDGTGAMKTISSEESPSHLKAAQVNLGLFGVVVEYTLEVKEMSNCRVQNLFDYKLMDAVDLPTCFGTEKLAKLLKDHWSIELFWFPFSGIMDWLLESIPSKASPEIKIPAFPPPEAQVKLSQDLEEQPLPESTPEIKAQVDVQVVEHTESLSPELAFQTEEKETSLLDVQPPEGSKEFNKIASQVFSKLQVTQSPGAPSKITLTEDIELDEETIQRLFVKGVPQQSSYKLAEHLEFESTFECILDWFQSRAASFFNKHPQKIPSWLLQFLVGVFWLPYLDKVWIRAIDKAPDLKLSREPGVPLWLKALDLAVGEVNSILAPTMQQNPALTPVALGIGFQGLKFQYGKLQGDEVVKTPWAVHYRDAIDLMHVTDMEFAFPIDIEDPKLAVEAIHAVVRITKECALAGSFSKDKTTAYPLTMCMEMRVIQKSESWLCPASVGSKSHVAYIEVLSSSDTPGYQEYFKKIAKEWMSLGGIPHWHKQWAFLEDKGIYDHIKKHYGQNLENFNEVRKMYDDKGLFLNETMKKLF